VFGLGHGQTAGDESICAGPSGYRISYLVFVTTRAQRLT
jgi:hypothetical protein